MSVWMSEFERLLLELNYLDPHLWVKEMEEVENEPHIELISVSANEDGFIEIGLVVHCERPWKVLAKVVLPSWFIEDPIKWHFFTVVHPSAAELRATSESGHEYLFLKEDYMDGTSSHERWVDLFRSQCESIRSQSQLDYVINQQIYIAATIGRVDVVQRELISPRVTPAIFHAAFKLAVENGQRDVVATFISEGPSLQHHTAGTYIELAVQKGNMDIASDLLACYSTPPLVNHLLLEMALDGHSNMVQLLLDQGADVDASDNKGRTALALAVEKDRLKTVRLLLNRVTTFQVGTGDHILDSSPIFSNDPRCQRTSTSVLIMQLILNKMATGDENSLSPSSTKIKPTWLQTLCRIQHRDLLQQMLAIDTYHRGDNNVACEAVLSAVKSREFTIARMLIQEGDVQFKRDWSVEQVSAQVLQALVNNDRETMGVLLLALRVVDDEYMLDNDCSLLDIAVTVCSAEIVALLVEYGAPMVSVAYASWKRESAVSIEETNAAITLYLELGGEVTLQGPVEGQTYTREKLRWHNQHNPLVEGSLLWAGLDLEWKKK